MPFGGQVDCRVAGRTCLIGGQGAVRCPEPQRERQRLVPSLDARAVVHVEQVHILEELPRTLAKGGQDVVGRQGAVDDERHILAQSLEFSEMAVSDLMRPINEVIALHEDLSIEENLDTVRRNSFTVLPR